MVNPQSLWIHGVAGAGYLQVTFDPAAVTIGTPAPWPCTAVRRRQGRVARRHRSLTLRRCNPVQGATATLAFTATLAMWNLQLTESKRGPRVRIPLSPPASNSSLALNGPRVHPNPESATQPGTRQLVRRDARPLLNPAAFEPPAPGTPGNVRRNSLSGPAF